MSNIKQSLENLALWNSLYEKSPDSEHVMAGYRACLLQFGKDAHAERQAVQAKRNKAKASKPKRSSLLESSDDEEPPKPKPKAKSKPKKK